MSVHGSPKRPHGQVEDSAEAERAAHAAAERARSRRVDRIMMQIWLLSSVLGLWAVAVAVFLLVGAVRQLSGIIQMK